ncbi:MAG: NAD(P)H-dependent oxidoreductase [Clostridia bacterium]|nr:NAD(P)H-dependent oxidoreductase [Clostridia bacterium]
MDICVIHGSSISGNNDKAIEIAKSRILQIGNVSFTDFYLPKDVPYLCFGCQECAQKINAINEECPYSGQVRDILYSMHKSDAIIICASVFSLSDNGQIKAFLDHFSYMYNKHFIAKSLFAKSALIISTTMGAGIKHPTRSISQSLLYWGVQKVHSCPLTFWTKVWNAMPFEKQQHCKETIRKKAEEFYMGIASKTNLRQVIHLRSL